MADPLLDIQLDDRRITELMEQLGDATEDMKPLMDQIGIRLLASTKRRFTDSEDPQGVPWKPVLKRMSYHAKPRPMKPPFRPLLHSGRLRQSIGFHSSYDQVVIGPPLQYGYKHQTGEGGMVKRQYIGASDQDKKDINNITIRYLRGLLRRTGSA